MLSDKSGALLVKPCKQAEIDFYESVRLHPKLKYFCPTFYGTLSLGQDSTVAANTPALGLTSSTAQPASGVTTTAPNDGSSGNPIGSSQAWVPSGGKGIKADTGLVLENLAHGFVRPNILDVKLGARLWAEDAPSAKRQKLDKVAAESTSGPLGYRIAGMKTWMGDIDNPEFLSTKGYKKYDKNYGRDISTDHVRTAFEDFFYVKAAGVTQKLGQKVIHRFIQDLCSLQEVMEGEESRMYSASLLFVYEGDGPTLEQDIVAQEALPNTSTAPGPATEPPVAEDSEIQTQRPDGEDDEEEIEIESNDSNTEPRIYALKIIDFAHATWTPGQGPDENLLHGVRNVIKVLKEMVK